MFARKLITAAALTAAALFSTGVLAQAQSLDQLLEQTKNARAKEGQANAARVAKFKSELDKQNGLLGEARAENNAQQARSNQLSAQFDANEKKLTELQAQLDAKGGNLGELFGATRQIANDFSSVVYNSMITAQFKERDEFVAGLSKTKALPSIEELERLWFEMQREMTETGRVAKYKATIVQPDGSPKETMVTRIGGFTSMADGDYLIYLPSQKQMSILPRQPHSPHPGLADDLEDAAAGYTAATLDPTRGVLMAMVTQRPTTMERIEQGELVGLIILAVGFIGAGLAIYQLVFLLGVSRRVKWQLANLAAPNTDNPLGRVLSSFKGSKAKLDDDPEVVELRLSEAVMKEVPTLERFQSFLRLAVAAGPLLGLVGTVVGMIITFQSIVESGSGDPKLMAAGISQAMIATVLGLGIAIPLLFVNAILQARSKQIVQILDEQSTGMLAERLEQKGA